ISMLRICSRNSAGNSSRARATSRAKRARRSRDTFATLAVALRRLPRFADGGPQPSQRSRADAADARLRQPHRNADLAKRQTATVREHDHTTLQLRESTELARDAVPTGIAARA